MKAVAIFALVASLIAAPLAPGAVQPVPAAQACASACCETNPSCCSTACPCPPLSCHVPAAVSAAVPASHPAFIFVPGSSHGTRVTDDTCSERTYRPPVPPPRA